MLLVVLVLAVGLSVYLGVLRHRRLEDVGRVKLALQSVIDDDKNRLRELHGKDQIEYGFMSNESAKYLEKSIEEDINDLEDLIRRIDGLGP
jgi:hypothetical protein